VRIHATSTGALPSKYSFVAPEAENVVLTSVKRAEDSDALIFRLYEWAEKSGDVQGKVPAGAKKVQLDNLMDQSEGSALCLKDGNTVTVPVYLYTRS
jgi:alpha-mannosidase